MKNFFLRPVPAGFLLAALILSSAVSRESAAQQGGPTPVGVDTVIAESLAQTMPVIGRLVAQRAGVVASRINGPVGKFDVRVGDRVEAGDVIASLIDDALTAQRDLWRAELAEAESGVATRRAELALRSQELERLEKLENSSAFNPAQVADKRQEVAIAESELAEYRAAVGIARENLKLAEINLFNAEIRAPYDGVVTARHTEVGAYVQVGSQVVSLIDDRSLEIEADVPTERISGLTSGTVVAFRFPDGETETATVRATVPDENPLTRTRSVRFSATLPANGTLAANQSVTLRIPVGAPRTVTSVHKDAVLDRGGKVVFVVEDGIANLRSVHLGVASGERFEVLAGLVPGERVVIRGNERLRPGQAVTPLAPPSNAGTAAGTSG